MKRIPLSALLLLFILTVRADDPWISLPGDNFQLNGKDARQIISIPVKLDKVLKMKDIRIEYNIPSYIRLDKYYDDSFYQAFVLLPYDGLPHIRVAVDLTKLRTPGTYQLSITLTKDSTGKDPLPLLISIIRPEAKLAPTPLIKIEMVGGDVVKADAFELKETEGVAISKLDLPAPVFTGVIKRTLLSFPANPYKLENHRLQVDYKLDTAAISDLPAGEYNGKMDIYTPEVKAPVSVDFKIINKASRWWIVGLLLAGVASGAFIRQFVKYKRDVDEKKLDGLTLLNRMRIETAKIADAPYKTAVEDLSAILRNKLKEKVYFYQWNTYVTALGTLTTETTTGYAALQNAFSTRLKTIRDKSNALSFVFGDNRLTPVLKSKLQDAADLYDTARKDLQALAVTSAEREVSATIAAVNSLITRYSQAIAALVANDGANLYPAAISQPLKDAIKQKCQAIATSLQTLTATAVDADGLINALRIADGIQLNLQDMLVYLKNMTILLFNTDHENDGSPLMTQFQTDMDAWKAGIDALLQDSLTPVNVTIVNNFDTTWTKVIAARPRPAAILANLAPQAALAAAASSNSGWLGSAMTLGRFTAIDVETPEVFIDRSLRQTSLSWLELTILQSLFIFLLMVGAAYIFYAPNFIGTLQEKLSLFLFAFGLNVSMDSVTAVRGYKGTNS